MADDEMKAEDSKAEEKKESKKSGKKTKRKSRKKKAKKTKKDAAEAVSADTILATLLVISLLANFYLYLQNNNLQADVEKYKNALMTNTGAGMTPTTTVPSTVDGAERVRLDFHVMSECPYGTQVMDAIAPVLGDMGDYVDFNVDYIATPLGNGQFQSLHGQTEVDENIRQLCAMKYYSGDYGYMDYIVCRNQNLNGDWTECAEEAGLDVSKIRTCAEGSEGADLLETSSQASQAAGATGSPTMFLNGQQYSGGRQTQDFMQALCAEMEEPAPACSNIPEPVEIEIIVLNDERCVECDTEMLETQLKSVFPGTVFRRLDYGTDEGRQLYERTGLTYLPAILFDETVETASGYSNVQNYLVEAGDLLSLRIGADFDPTAEICDNGIDDTGDGVVDCEDEDCIDKLICREEMLGKLDVFVMSMCPYGTRALDAMEEVLAAFPEMDFDIWYVASYNEDTDTFSSLHGQPEVEENIRELCAIEHYPDDYEYMEYIWCRNEDISSTDWESCAEQAGMDVETLRACSEGEEGKELLRENIGLANTLGIGASPTWMANNRYTFSGITAEAVQTNFCEQNPELEGCEESLSSDSDVASGSC